MDEKTIIIADRDLDYCGTIAVFFRRAGYRVEATASADQVLRSVHERRAPVLLLGSAFGSEVPSPELVRLLKKCNRQLQIIMVCDEVSLDQERKVRQEGIFYHALKPASEREAAELGQAVACAFEKQAADARRNRGHCLLPAAVHHEKVRPQLVQLLPWMVGLVVLMLATNYLSFSSVNTAQDGNNFAVWLFLGFCAAIVIGQLLPIFRIKLATGRAAQRQGAPEKAGRGGN
ncbi:hypothetical protein GMLC_17390 [Geomonas limicola]|uniref:Response regulatory domain-containing protein n=1 Tax=Geomonas limicola TaxID=2740186 RepID=A0A6V8N732_9BACT|nr:response regulator [Geomonas limicola]GFO68160.1 hypothetical protein GMLC_17390 [Geomonas limicola]